MSWLLSEEKLADVLIKLLADEGLGVTLRIGACESLVAGSNSQPHACMRRRRADLEVQLLDTHSEVLCQIHHDVVKTWVFNTEVCPDLLP